MGSSSLYGDLEEIPHGIERLTLRRVLAWELCLEEIPGLRIPDKA